MSSRDNKKKPEENPEHQPDHDTPSEPFNEHPPNAAAAAEPQPTPTTAEDEETRQVKEMEARLPRPEWYTSDDEDSSESSEDVKETSELKAKPPGGVGLLTVYILFCFVSFAFNLASSCPIPWLRARQGGRKYGVWKEWGGGLPDLKVKDITGCSEEKQYWQATSAFSVIATVFSFGATVAGLLLVLGHGHVGASFALSFYCTAFSLGAWALVVALFHFYRCGKGVFAVDLARLDAGFALTLIAFVLQLISLVVLLIYFTTYYTKSIHAGKQSPMRWIYVVMASVVMLLYCVGPALEQWSKEFPLIKCSFSIWHVKIYDRNSLLTAVLSRKAYRCSTIIRRMKVVAGFVVMSNIWMFLSLMFGIGACYREKLCRPANVLGWASVFFFMVAWLVLMITRYDNLCTSDVPPGSTLWPADYNGVPTGVFNAKVRFDGYKWREGFALMITGWALNVVASLLNCIF